MAERATAFADVLHAGGPAVDRAGKMDLYGWLVGSWELDVTEFLTDGSERRRPGEWHCGWVLEGRAIQDVWIVPSRRLREQGDAAANADYYGTTLRTWDPRIDAWHIQYTDPVMQAFVTMISRRQGNDIVQDGKDSAGNLRRWSFSDITAESFLWRGEVSVDGGATWHLHIEYRAHRTGSA